MFSDLVTGNSEFFNMCFEISPNKVEQCGRRHSQYFLLYFHRDSSARNEHLQQTNNKKYRELRVVGWREQLRRYSCSMHLPGADSV
jgi:hypothetical protein